MKPQPPSFLRLLGLRTQGDIGPYTSYRSDRGKLVFFLKAPPKKPPTYRQETNRGDMVLAAVDWSRLAEVERQAWRDLSKKSRVTCTGFNLWFYAWKSRDHAPIKTLSQQTGIALVLPSR